MKNTHSICESRQGRSIVLALAGVLATHLSAHAVEHRASSPYFGIHVVDEQTGRGVPLVELKTVNHLQFVTDSAGWIAFGEPDLMSKRVFFHVRSHGYEYPRDRFGYAGIVLTPAAGHIAEIRLPRRNIAERLYRITGSGIYRDSLLLNKTTPLSKRTATGNVVGQDSASAIPYRDKIYWFWGDTNRIRYPLGQFWTSGATSRLPDDGGLDPARGVHLEYFVNADGFSRPMARLGVKKGLIWIDSVCTLPDDTGRKRLVCHYAHMQSLGKTYGHGLAVYNDKEDRFERLMQLDDRHHWKFPGQAHPVRRTDGGIEYLYLGEVFPTVRVRATLEGLRDIDNYEAWTCLKPDGDSRDPAFVRDENGQLQYAWRKNAMPADIAAQWKWVAGKQIAPDEACFVPVDEDSGKPIRLHRGSVAWNDYRKKWIMIANQRGGTSYLGEVWYAEAPEPTGPWRRAKKIVTHDQYSFYNPVHHSFFDQDGGRVIYFEGTYTTTFSKNPSPTPRYNYNQIMYRLDLADPRL